MNWMARKGGDARERSDEKKRVLKVDMAKRVGGVGKQEKK